MVKSPCIGVCKIQENGLCAGCRRTLSEIANWKTYSAEQKQQIINSLKERNANY